MYLISLEDGFYFDTSSNIKMTFKIEVALPFIENSTYCSRKIVNSLEP